MRHLPLGFFTSTTFASQVVYWASPTNPACLSLLASSIAACLLLSPSFLFFCETGLALGKTDNLWEAILGCTPGRSAADHAKRSALCVRMLSMWCSSPLGRVVPIWRNRFGCGRGKCLMSPTGSTLASEFILGSRSSPAKAALSWDCSILWVVKGGWGSFRLGI